MVFSEFREKREIRCYLGVFLGVSTMFIVTISCARACVCACVFFVYVFVERVGRREVERRSWRVSVNGFGFGVL